MATLPFLGRLEDVPPPAIRHCGVYFLFLADEVIYVGQSTQADVRVALHREQVSFDRASLLRLPADDLDAYEGAIIRALRPRLNRSCPRPTAREFSILAELGLSPHVPWSRAREVRRLGLPRES